MKHPMSRHRNRVFMLFSLLFVLSIIISPLAVAEDNSGHETGNITIVRKAALNGNINQQMLSPRLMPQQFASITGYLGTLPPAKNRYAIIIGSNYEGCTVSSDEIPFTPDVFPLQLEYAQADALCMQELLGYYQFNTETNVIALVGEDASHANIMDAIEQIKEQVNGNDEVVFYYSGHGAQLIDAEGTHQGIVTDEGDGTDVGFIWDYELAREFNRLNTHRIIFIFDSCLAGGMTELADNGRIVCMATTIDGVAIEAPVNPITYEAIEHGLFTYFLLAAFSGSIPEEYVEEFDPDGIPTVEEAFNFSSSMLIFYSDYIEGILGETLAEYWHTPVIVDLYPRDLVL